MKTWTQALAWLLIAMLLVAAVAMMPGGSAPSNVVYLISG